MSSYIDSAYSIERRRLQGIVSQCEKELEDAISAVAAKKYERQSSQKKFQDNIKKGQQTHGDDKRLENMGRSSFLGELFSRCDSLERIYGEEMDAAIQIQLNEIRNHIHQRDVHEELLVIMIDRCEEELVKKTHNKSIFIDELNKENKNPDHKRRIISEGKKGMKLGNPEKKVEDSLTYDSLADEFEQRLQEVKSFASSEDRRLVQTIECEYKNQPDFAKTLYLSKALPQLEAILQKEINKKDTIKKAETKADQLMKRYEALMLLLKNEESNRITYTSNLEGISLKALELQCEELEKALVEKRKKEYMLSAVKTVMQKHGIVCCDLSKNNVPAQSYQYDENVDFSISGILQNRFVAEMKGKYFGKAPTLDDRRRSVASAKKACGFLKKIRDELEQDYGIIFDDVEIIDPSEKTITMGINNFGNCDEKAVYANEDNTMMFEE